MFAIVWAAAFAIIAVLALAAETQLDHFAAFVLPLGAIVFLLTGLQTTLFHRLIVPAGWWSVLASVAIALAVGVGLAGQGDEESGKLELPPKGAVRLAPPMGGYALAPGSEIDR